MLPFFGYIQHQIFFLTRLAPIIQDVTTIIPLYFLFVIHKLKKNDSNLLMPDRLKNCLYFIILLVGIYTINPFFDQILMVRLIGVKVWIFYFLFFAIGFEIIESELELKKLCNFFAYVAFFPCVIGILLYLFSYFLDYKQTMIFFYNGNEFIANLATNNYSYFDWGLGIKLFRLPSTFTHPAQYVGYLYLSLIMIISALALSETKKNIYFLTLILILTVLGIFASGSRGSFIYMTMFFIFLLVIRLRLYNILIIIVPTLAILTLVNLEQFPVLNVIYTNISDLTTHYSTDYIFKDFGDYISNNLLGSGVGAATREARYAGVDLTNLTEFSRHESFYYKTLIELGIIGFITILTFFILIIREIFLSIRYVENARCSMFCAALLAYFSVVIIALAKGTGILNTYPSNFLIYFFIGIAIKLRYLNRVKVQGTGQQNAPSIIK